MYNYIVPVTNPDAREEIEWAWRFTVLASTGGACAWCGTRTPPIDACHVVSRAAEPDREFDPTNGIALCRSCHMKHDHRNKHRPSGRPVGSTLSEGTKRKIGESNRRTKSTPEMREFFRRQAIEQWANQPRKTAPHPCEHCGTMITGHRQHSGARFCSAACHYAFRTGKARSGY